MAETDDRARAESEASILQFSKNHANNLLEAARKIGEKAAIERAKGAEALLNTQSLQIMRRVVGPAHPNTLGSMTKLPLGASAV